MAYDILNSILIVADTLIDVGGAQDGQFVSIELDPIASRSRGVEADSFNVLANMGGVMTVQFKPLDRGNEQLRQLHREQQVEDANGIVSPKPGSFTHPETGRVTSWTDARLMQLPAITAGQESEVETFVYELSGVSV